MPTKAELYAQMAEKVATQLTGSWQEWAGFLTTASRLYKYPFHEQLMIYAQRPDATACAEYDLWNEKMGRYVRRGSKGIALVDDSGDRPRLRYVFDISDTGTREHSRTPWLWQLEERHLDSVQAMLERTYDVSGDDLAGQLTEVAGKLAEEYWTEHQQDFFYIVDGSFLEEYDEFNIGVQFKAAATVSITYALMSRCGLEPERYFDHEDFMAIFDFNTPATIGALGTAVSQINQQVLRQIGVTVRNAEREANQERSKQDEQSHDLYPERRLSDSRAEAEPAAGENPGQVRQAEENLPEGTSSHLEVMDAEEKRLAMLYFRWDEVAPLLRGMYARQQDGFGQEQPQPATESPTFHSETMAVYPGDKNNLPYDVVVERLHIEEPEPPAPVTEPEKTFENTRFPFRSMASGRPSPMPKLPRKPPMRNTRPTCAAMHRTSVLPMSIWVKAVRKPSSRQISMPFVC